MEASAGGLVVTNEETRYQQRKTGMFFSTSLVYKASDSFSHSVSWSALPDPTHESDFDEPTATTENSSFSTTAKPS